MVRHRGPSRVRAFGSSDAYLSIDGWRIPPDNQHFSAISRQEYRQTSQIQTAKRQAAKI